MSDRLLQFEGVYNFRDFGGYASAHGGAVKRGRLYRSAHLARATEGDHARLRDMGIAVVADLRRTEERRLEPSAWAEGEAGGPRVIACDLGERSSLPPHLQFLKETGRLDEDSVRAYMISVYERLPFEERHQSLFSQTLCALAEGEAPLLVHCAAGKDRTGVLCALILTTLGVSREDVFEDYDLTNRNAAIDGILEQAAQRFSAKLERDITPDQLRPMIGVDAEYLEAALDAITREVGTVERYLETALGAGAESVAAMRAHLLDAEA